MMRSGKIYRLFALTGAAVLAVSVAGCGNKLAGSQIDDGRFGQATLQNTQVHTGEIKVLRDMSARFNAEVPSTINFAFNSATIDTTAGDILQQQAAFMLEYPELRFSVFGHTDAVGTDEYNRRLGERRAQAVVDYLGTLGVSSSRLDALVSFGAQQPLVASQNRERANRRTVTEVAGFVSDKPLVYDGRLAETNYRTYLNPTGEGGGDDNAASAVQDLVDTFQ